MPLPAQVFLATPRGFCAGVDRAIAIVERALEKFGAPIYVRHEVVHNKFVVDDLKAKGAIFIEDLNDVPAGATLIYSAHGVPQSVRREAESRGLQVFDATCPLVTKVHREAVRFAKQEKQILLIGHEGHEEVEGTYGEAPEHTTIINNPDEARTVQVEDPDNLIWLSQTTLSVDETLEIVSVLRERFPNLQDPPSDDICYATSNRQAAIKSISPECDLVIIVGSANSSNSVRLKEVAAEYGASRAERVDFASQVDESWFEGVSTVGLSSGASVPEVLIQDVLALLAESTGPETLVVPAAGPTYGLLLEHARLLRGSGFSTAMVLPQQGITTTRSKPTRRSSRTTARWPRVGGLKAPP
jgi:4-hydroxy-3-methylbut-2-enyl diphosphate reductase